jgi:hypothetical protein
MKLDRTLIDKDGAPSVDELKEYFRNNDYTTAQSTFNPSRANPRLLSMYMKAKGFFKEKWLSVQKSMGGKGSLKNFSANYPLQVLEKADEDLIAGTVGDILLDDELTAQIIDSYFAMMEEPLNTGFNAYAASVGKFPDDLTDEEVKMVVDKVTDLFLTEMMSLMMQSQSVPEILGVAKKNGAHEDFNPNVAENRDKIDFDRKWDHIRTKLGKPLSLDELSTSNPSALEEGRGMFDTSDEEYDILENQFLDSLNGTDREIYLMRKQGFTQQEIAERLGYKSHSAVTKRMEKMKKALIDFCADFNN